VRILSIWRGSVIPAETCGRELPSELEDRRGLPGGDGVLLLARAHPGGKVIREPDFEQVF
jgi:hypothetical protein